MYAILLSGSILFSGGMDRVQTGLNEVKWSDYGRVEAEIKFLPIEYNWNVILRGGHIERLNNDELGLEDDIFNSNYIEFGVRFGR